MSCIHFFQEYWRHLSCCVLLAFSDFHVAVYLQDTLLQHTSRATAFTIRQRVLWDLVR